MSTGKFWFNRNIKLFIIFFVLSLYFQIASPVFATSTLNTGITGFWNLNESSGSRSDSVGSTTLTDNGSVGSATGVVSNAASFSGSNWLSVADNAAVSMGDIDFTVAGWVYLTSKSTNSPIVAKYDSDSPISKEYYIQYHASTDKFIFGVGPDGTTNATAVFANSFGSPSLNTWYYVVGWHDSVNNTINIQINDGIVDSASYSLGVFDGTAAFSIGSYTHGAGVFLTGRIDSAGLWKRILTSTERTQLYNSGNGLEYPFVPSVPTSVSVTAGGDAQATISFTAPSSSGSSITGYTVTSNPDNITATGSASPITVTGLTNGTPYTFTVTATNAMGTSTSSSASNSVTPTANPTAPDAPSGLVIVPGNTSAFLSWTAPSNGGSAITDYVIEYKLSSDSSWTVFDDGVSTTASTTVTSITNNLLYNFRVSAKNSVGTGSVSGTSTATPIPLNTNLSGFWNLNETSGSRADSVGSNTLTDNGSVGSATGVVSNAASFSGSNYLSITDNAALSTGDIDSTLAGWVYLTSKSTNAPIVAKYDSSISPTKKEYYLQYGSTSDQFQFGVSPDGLTTTGYVNGTSFGSPSLNTWYYVVAWHDSVNNTVNIQVNNGTVDSASYSSGVFDGTSAFYIGSYSQGTVFLTGRIDAAGIWKRVLNPTDRTALYNSGSGLELAGAQTAPSTITDLTIVRGNSKAMLSWSAPSNGNSAITNYVIEYKLSSSGSYATFNDGVSAETSMVVSSLTNGESYDFRVSAINSVGTSTASNVVSVTPQNIPYYSILVTGQSLALGGMGTPALTITQPYDNTMLGGCTITTGSCGNTLVPLIENSGSETVNSALANTIISLIGASPNASIAMSTNAKGGAAYSVIKKNGSDPIYSQGISNITTINTLVNSLSESYRVLGTVLIHGEADIVLIGGGGTDTYASDISQLQSDYNTDLKAITGQSQTIPMFTDQTMSFTGYGYATSPIPQDQLSASESNPNMYLVTPKYIFDYDSVGSQSHLINTSYQWLGEYYGKVIKKVMIDGQSWVPLSPKTITRNANVIYAQLNVPVAPVVIDTTKVLSKSNYGFEYYDGSSSASISSVEIINSDTVKITLSATPTGSNQRLRYAYTGTPNSRPGAQISGSARGNIRDSDNTASLYGNDLSNWLVSFDKTIVLDETAPSTPTATPSIGTYNSTQSVTLSATGSDYIKYSLTETPATCLAGTLYSDSTPISVATSQTIYVRACDNSNNSSTQSFAYVIDSEAPSTTIATPVAGTYTTTQSISLTSTGSDSIRYSITETPATCSAGTLYSDSTPISIATSQTIYVRACDTLTNFSTTNFTYTISPVHQSSGGSSTYAMAQFKTTQQALNPTPTPTVTSASSVPFTPIVLSRILKLSTLRMWGDDVLALQTLLNTKGYNSGTPDGNFGPKTKAAVIAFQSANGLVPDGSVGTNTLKYLNGNQAITTTTPATIQPTVTRILKLSIPRMIGDDVLALQNYLNTKGYDVGALDGVLGPKTRTAIIAFQTANGLTPDGLVGIKTREVMK